MQAQSLISVATLQMPIWPWQYATLDGAVSRIEIAPLDGMVRALQAIPIWGSHISPDKHITDSSRCRHMHVFRIRFGDFTGTGLIGLDLSVLAGLHAVPSPSGSHTRYDHGRNDALTRLRIASRRLGDVRCPRLRFGASIPYLAQHNWSKAGANALQQPCSVSVRQPGSLARGEGMPSTIAYPNKLSV